MNFPDIPIVNFFLGTVMGAPFSAAGSAAGFLSGIIQFFTGLFES